MITKTKSGRVIPSSGNVFKDIGFPEAEERLAKSELAYKIMGIVKELEMNQTQAAKVLGVDRARVSDLSRGRLRSFSMEKLFTFLNRLDHDVEVSVHPKRHTQASLYIAA